MRKNETHEESDITTSQMIRIAVLAKHLGKPRRSVEDVVEVAPFDTCMFNVGGMREYLVLSFEEANDRAREYILDSVWAFSTSFLQAHARDGVDISALDDYRSKACEDANTTMLALIKDVDHFVDDAILSDGRGHFLSPYDGVEHEVKLDGQYWFVYRVD